jgi:hypothetical protein
MMLQGLSARIRRDTARLQARKLLNTALVTVSYQQPVPGSDPVDPSLESTTPATTTVTTDPIPAFVHFVEPVKSITRQFTEIETGDAIIDFLDDVVLPRTGAKFVIDGETYVQKEVGNQLAQYWDVIVQGQRHFRTVVATKAPGSRTT